LQDSEITIIEPEIFRKADKTAYQKDEQNEAILLYEEIEVLKIKSLKEITFSIAFEIGCRAIDSFYVAA